MPYADNQGVRIHYRVEGEGPPLVLQHGMIQSIEDWYERGYVGALTAAGFRLILADARGLGRSDKPHDPALLLVREAILSLRTIAPRDGAREPVNASKRTQRARA